ncbi:hypothetical protein BDV12DRAFT_111682 [Aspergillus spectabilis]
MRFLFSFLTTLAAITVGSTALQTSIFTFRPEAQTRDQELSLISSATLQQLLELRGGSSTSSTLEGSDESTIELLSRLAGPSNRVFGAPIEDGGLSTIVVILEGLGHNIDSSLRSEYQSGLVTSAFATESTRDVFFNTLLDARPNDIVGLKSKHCSFYSTRDVSSETREITKLNCLTEHFEIQPFVRTLNNGLLDQASVGESWIDELKGTLVLRLAFKTESTSTGPSVLLESLNSLFSDLHSLASNGKRVTAAILPSSNATRKLSYSRRALDVSKMDSTTISSVRNTQPMAFEPRAKVPLSLAPVCYASNSTCNEATNSCSGHGVCYKKSGSESEAGSGDCYACRCYETYVKNEDGTERKVQWGGSACQKKDISSPFFLIAGVTITITVVVSAAIGMLFGVGNTELPGVISAGVGAVRTQK